MARVRIFGVARGSERDHAEEPQLSAESAPSGCRRRGDRIPEGWWWLRVAGSGPADVVATMRQGDERRFVPVKVPATYPGGAVTATR